MAEKLFSRRRLTMVGEIRGQERQKLAGIDYPYVLLRAKALRLWPPAGEKPLHPIYYYYPWEVTPRIGGTVRIISKGKLLTSFF